jgi:KDO2-lipid IV(A) lauroyltransferase
MRLAFLLLAWLPLRLLHALGAGLGSLLHWASPALRRDVAHNTRLASLSPEQVTAAIAEAGRMVAELPWIWSRGAGPLRAAIQWDGLELIEEELAKGKGLIYLTPHLGCFEALPAAHAFWLAPRFGSITVLYRPLRSGALDRMAKTARDMPGVETAPTNTSGVRALLKALRRGAAVGLLPDQVPESGLGVWAPFFGQPAYTMTLAGSLARHTGAPLLLVCGERLPRGQGFRIHVRPIELPLTESDEAIAAVMNRQLEDLILEYPSQYLWGYARYKAPARRTLSP